MEKGDKIHGYILASKANRFLASLIQYVSILLFFGLIYGITLLANPKGNPITQAVFFIVISIVLGIIHRPYIKGNLGHRLLKLKVINCETGNDYNKIALREFLKHLLMIFIIPIIWILWDKKKQNLYDKITKTVVVKL